MIRAAALVAIAVAIAWPVREAVLRARWRAVAPRSAIVLWQAIGIAFIAALLCACAQLAATPGQHLAARLRVTDADAAVSSAALGAPLTAHGLFWLTTGIMVTALVVGALATRAVGVRRARATQRSVVDLVGEAYRGDSTTLVVDHPRPAAYCVPGRSARVVLSTGTLALLGEDEVAAVIAHERAHVRAHHHLVLLPFQAMASALPGSRALARVAHDVGTLVEMAADDAAIRCCGVRSLALALCRLGVEAGGERLADALGGDGDAVARAARCTDGRRHARLSAFASTVAAAGIVALPLVTALAPTGTR